MLLEEGQVNLITVKVVFEPVTVGAPASYDPVVVVVVVAERAVLDDFVVVAVNRCCWTFPDKEKKRMTGSLLSARLLFLQVCNNWGGHKACTTTTHKSCRGRNQGCAVCVLPHTTTRTVSAAASVRPLPARLHFFSQFYTLKSLSFTT